MKEIPRAKKVWFVSNFRLQLFKNAPSWIFGMYLLVPSLIYPLDRFPQPFVGSILKSRSLGMSRTCSACRKSKCFYHFICPMLAIFAYHPSPIHWWLTQEACKKQRSMDHSQSIFSHAQARISENPSMCITTLTAKNLKDQIEFTMGGWELL